MTVAVRAAVVEDVEAISSVFMACWSTSYANVLPASDISRWSPHRAQRAWTDHVTAARGQNVSVAEVDQAIAGVVRWHAEGSVAEIDSLYVSPAMAGRGVGRLLVEATCEAAVNQQCRRLLLWVFETNDSAREFYRRLGFVEDGRRHRTPDYSVVEIGMERVLANTGRGTEEA